MNRITEHPILETEKDEEVSFYYNGEIMKGQKGDTIAAALVANGIRVFRSTVKKHEPRGLYCGIGQCLDCIMVVNGKPNVRTCITRLEEGMKVEFQAGLGSEANEKI